MKVLLPLTLLLLASLYNLDAWMPTATRPKRRVASSLLPRQQSKTATDEYVPKTLTHADVVWRLRPPPEYPLHQRIMLRLASNALRLESLLKKTPLPIVLCPQGGKAVLEAHYQTDGGDLKKIARFGITTQSGPPIPPIQETVADIYGLDTKVLVQTAAIIYMFVEPEYRSKGLGPLALEVISLVHASQGCDFTVLVADDDGSGKLVKWYESHGYTKAPKLQDVFGSPGGKYGITMIAPTVQRLPGGCTIEWW